LKTLLAPVPGGVAGEVELQKPPRGRGSEHFPRKLYGIWMFHLREILHDISTHEQKTLPDERNMNLLRFKGYNFSVKSRGYKFTVKLDGVRLYDD
jgi:hypothetical protein